MRVCGAKPGVDFQPAARGPVWLTKRATVEGSLFRIKALYSMLSRACVMSRWCFFGAARMNTSQKSPITGTDGSLAPSPARATIVPRLSMSACA